MTTEEIKSFPWRAPESRHAEVKKTAADLRMSMQDLIDAALDSYLSKDRPPMRDKEMREMHVLLDRLNDHLDHGNYATYKSIIRKLLSTVEEEFPDK